MPLFGQCLLAVCPWHIALLVVTMYLTKSSLKRKDLFWLTVGVYCGGEGMATGA